MIEKNAVMVDLETLGSGPTSAILSLGAVRFDRRGIIERFQRMIDVQTCIDVGMTVDGDTFYWWLRQSQESRTALYHSIHSIQSSLNDFANWIGDCESMWGNGSDFDNTILAYAYRCCGIHQPWRWSRNRCYRTVKNLCPSVEMVRVGTHHSAMDDAESQALHLIECLKSLEITGLSKPVDVIGFANGVSQHFVAAG